MNKIYLTKRCWKITNCQKKVTKKCLLEKFLHKHGISSGMWNEGGRGLLIIVPLTADAMWFEELEYRLIQALRDYSSTVAGAN